MATATVPGYEDLEVLQDGRRVVTYRAVRAADRVPVVLRVPTDPAPTAQDLSALEQEYRLTHDPGLSGVVAPYALHQQPGRLVLVQEDFGGVPLARLIVPGGLGAETFLSIALQLADTLRTLHEQKIIHKNLHPESIFVNPETGTVKLAGFDLASRLTRETQAVQHPASIGGRLAYMAPEQTGRMNRPVDYRADFYALGVTFYEMLTGELPFAPSDPMELVHCHLARRPVPPRERAEGVPEVLSDIVMKLLAKTAEERYQSAAGLHADLAECRARLGPDGRIAPFPLGRYDVAERLLIPQRIYGREDELERLMAAFERVSEGAVEVVLVTGYGGIGKSRLVHEIHRPIVRQRGRFIEGKFDQLGRDRPYRSLIQAFQQLVRGLLTEGDERVEAMRERLREALGANASVLVEVIPEVALLLGPQPPAPELGPTEAQNRFRLVFRTFVGVFARPEHPLVLFLDDLQWADAASLDLIRHLVTDRSAGYLLVIGAYRDSEVAGAHPLRSLERELAEAGVEPERLHLAPLSRRDLTQWIADALTCTREAVEPLADLVERKTNGNPFFTAEFLQTAYGEGLLRIECARAPGGSPDEEGPGCRWSWDLGAIEALENTSNVVELMIARIQRLAPETQAVLKLAACIGNRFDSKTLSFIFERPRLEAALALWDALAAGLIVPLDDTYRMLDGAALGVLPDEAVRELAVPFRFFHDRVQQAAYALIPGDERAATHLHVGRLLRRALGAVGRDGAVDGSVDGAVFEVANHYNEAAGLVTDPGERVDVARINLAAGRKAKASTAYGPALAYLAAGTDVLGESGWTQHPDLAFALHLERAECESLTTRFEDAHARFERLLAHARTDAERVAVHRTRLTLFLHLRDYEAALATGRAALAILGLPLAAEPSLRAVLTELVGIRWRMRGRTPASLADLPTCTDPDIETAMQVLIDLWFPAYLLKRERLIGLIVLKMVHLSLRHGHTKASSFAYACYGTFTSSALGKTDAGAAFGALALDLARRFGDAGVTAKTLFVLASFLQHFSGHLRANVDHLHEAFGKSLEAGDLIQAGYCADVILYWLPLLGVPLDRVEAEAERFYEFGLSIGSPKVCQNMLVARRWVEALRDADPAEIESPAHSFEPGPDITEDMEMGLHHLLQLQVAYLFGHYDAARRLAERMPAYPELMEPSVIFVPYHALYHGLALVALLPGADREERRAFEKQLKACRKTVRRWAENSPENIRHKHLLLEAACAGLRGDAYRAAEGFDEAVAAAWAQGYVQEAALGSELAAALHAAAGRDRIAEVYLQNARRGYRAWGAAAMVRALERRHASLRRDAHFPEPAAGPPRAAGPARAASELGSDSMDLETVMKAAQVLSGEIVLEALLRRVLDIVMENAGAQRGFLIFQRDDGLVIEAEGAVDGGEGTVLRSVPVEESRELSHAIVNYVARTHESVVLSDAAREGLFTGDAYVGARAPKSVLCTPLRHQGHLLGVVYLENNLVTGAFTPERLEVLRLLSSQVAISIENARLYNDLERKVAARTQEIQERNDELQQAMAHLQRTQAQLVQQEKMASLGALTAGIAHEIKNPLNFVNNFAGLTRELVEEAHRARAAGDEEELAALLDDVRMNAAKIEEHGRRADGIVRSMMEHARGTGGDRRVVDLNALVDEHVELAWHGRRARDPGVEARLVRDYGEDVGEVEVMPQEIGRVVLNLVSNAFDAVSAMDVRPPGNGREDGAAVRPSVRVSTRRVGERVEVRVEDDGPGIPENVRGKIFEPFFTTKPAGAGTGLGLSMSHDIVTQGHEGTLEVESEVGRGAAFIVILPIRRGEGRGEPAPLPRPSS